MAFLGEITLTRRRFDASTLVAGRAVPGASADSTFLGSLQPFRGRDRQVLPEGVRAYDGRKVYCPIGTLRTANQHDGTPADQVLFGAIALTVVHVDDDHRLIPHDRVYLVRVQERQ